MTASPAPPSAPPAAVGYDPDELRLDQPTRSARLKWVVVVDEALAAGQAANAVVCVTAATAAAVPGLLGPAATDAGGGAHPGLPWAGCTVLGAPRAELARIRAAALTAPGTYVADAPAAAQRTRVYAEYLAAVADRPADDLDYLAVSLVGPRNRVDRVVRRLPLLGSGA